MKKKIIYLKYYILILVVQELLYILQINTMDVFVNL